MTEHTGILAAIGNTPIIKLTHIVPEGSADVYVKLENLNPSGSYKDRMALSMIEEAERTGKLKAGMTVIECTAGSTGTSLALVCAAKGYRFRAISSDAFAPEKLKTMEIFGANLELIPSENGKITPDLIPRMIAHAEKLSLEGNYYWTQQFQNTDSIAGFRGMGDEVVKQLSGTPDAFVAAVGTAVMFMGVASALRAADPNTKCVILEPASAPLISKGLKGSHKVEGIGVGFVPPLLQRDSYDEVIAIEEEEARAMANTLAREEGILGGTSSGLNVVGALRVAKTLGKGKRVLTVICDNGLKYLNQGLFDRD
jgi:cysteine synthase